MSNSCSFHIVNVINTKYIKQNDMEKRKKIKMFLSRVYSTINVFLMYIWKNKSRFQQHF